MNHNFNTIRKLIVFALTLLICGIGYLLYSRLYINKDSSMSGVPMGTNGHFPPISDSSKEVQNWNLYMNSKYGYALQYPRDFEVRPMNDSLVYIREIHKRTNTI